jgi:hypothetical protein
MVEMGTLTLAEGTAPYSVTIPASAPRGALTSIIFRFREPLAGITPPQALLVESAGLAVGDFAHIYFNGEDLADTRTGYHAALFQNETLIEYAHFDTFNDPEASAALVDFLNNAPNGATLALAAADTPSAGEGGAGGVSVK